MTGATTRLRKWLDLWRGRQLRRQFRADGVLRLGASTRIRAGGVAYRRGCRLIVGDNTGINANIVFEKEGAEVTVGSRTWIGNSVLSVASQVAIGDDVLISWGVTISDHGAHAFSWSKRRHDVVEYLEGRKNWDHVPIKPVHIGDKAWIGLNAILMKGITIGEGSVVGAGSVVTKDIPPWTVVAGNPARVIRTIRDEER